MIIDQGLEYFREKHGYGYKKIRRLADGSIAGIMPLIFTDAICLGMDEYGFHTRYCFEDKLVAQTELEKLQSEYDEPQGYVDKRPRKN